MPPKRMMRKREPRPPSGKIRKRGPAAVRYDALRAKWEDRRADPRYAGGGDRWIEKPDLSLDAAPFLQTLRVLGEVTQDRRFADMRTWIIEESDLVDIATGRWTRFGVAFANPVTRAARNCQRPIFRPRPRRFWRDPARAATRFHRPVGPCYREGCGATPAHVPLKIHSRAREHVT